MLHQPISSPRQGATDAPAGEHVDRSMDVLQYATAFLAIIVAVLLAVLR
jgi:hypothetical protein